MVTLSSKQAPTRTPGPVVSQGCSAFVAAVALLPTTVTVGPVLPAQALSDVRRDSGNTPAKTPRGDNRRNQQ